VPRVQDPWLSTRQPNVPQLVALMTHACHQPNAATDICAQNCDECHKATAEGTPGTAPAGFKRDSPRMGWNWVGLFSEFFGFPRRPQSRHRSVPNKMRPTNQPVSGPTTSTLTHSFSYRSALMWGDGGTRDMTSDVHHTRRDDCRSPGPNFY
jgi:hypothetical protein